MEPSSNITTVTTISSTQKMNHNFKVVVTFGLVMIILNGICAMYLLVRTLIRWFVTRKSLPMALRVPFYIASSDFIIFSINFPNLLYPSIYGVPWPGPDCKIIGAITSFAISTNMTLVGLLAFLTYLRICRKMYINLGKYDYKGIIFVLTTSLIYSLMSIPSYDSGKYWCFTNPSSNRILPIVTLVLNFTVLAITIISYSLILREINSLRFINEYNKEKERERNAIVNSNNYDDDDDLNDNGNDSTHSSNSINSSSNDINTSNSGNNILSRTRSMLSNNGNNNNNSNNGKKKDEKNVKKIEPIVVRKIIGYVLIFIIQWTPPMIYVIGQLVNYDPLWVYLITDATVNMGGIGNLIQFIINEGWRDKYDLPSPSLSKGSGNASFAGVSTEPTTHVDINHIDPNFENFEIKINFDTNDIGININEINNNDNEKIEKLRPCSASSSSTKVSNNNDDYEYFKSEDDSKNY